MRLRVSISTIDKQQLCIAVAVLIAAAAIHTNIVGDTLRTFVGGGMAMVAYIELLNRIIPRITKFRDLYDAIDSYIDEWWPEHPVKKSVSFSSEDNQEHFYPSHSEEEIEARIKMRKDAEVNIEKMKIFLESSKAYGLKILEDERAAILERTPEADPETDPAFILLSESVRESIEIADTRLQMVAAPLDELIEIRKIDEQILQKLMKKHKVDA
jgi:hypothetical protein